jgi:hypothetical protein
MSRASRIIERLVAAGIAYTRDGDAWLIPGDRGDTHVFTTAQVEAFLVGVEEF